MSRRARTRLSAYVDEFFRLRQRYGITRTEAHEWMLNNNYFGAMMVHMGDADGFIAGVSQHYPETIRPALQIIRTAPGGRPRFRPLCDRDQEGRLFLRRHHRQH